MINRRTSGGHGLSMRHIVSDQLDNNMNIQPNRIHKGKS